ncbi:MAG: DUF5655 domain-containing protein [Candidatus Nanopelagicales bacterium]
MADPTAASMNQLRNIQGKTGKSIAELHALLDGTGLSKHGEKRTWLIDNLGLGYGDANAVVGAQGKDLSALDGAAPAPAAPAGDPLDAIYTGGKAHLRSVHDAVIAAVDSLGDYEQAPKKSYVSLRRKKQFAMVGPATKDLVEIGLNVKDLPDSARLKAMPAGSMCSYTLRIGTAKEVDAELKRWLKAAYDAAG